MKVSEVEKCNKLRNKIIDLKAEVDKLYRAFNRVDQIKLDNEEDQEWNSDIVNEYIEVLGDMSNKIESVI